MSLAAALLSGLSRGSEFQQMFATGCYRAGTEKHASYGVNTIFILNAVAIWPITGQGFQNTKWPAVLYYQ